MLPNIKSSKKNIYLDYAATTPLDPQVKKVMEPFLQDAFGNPSSLYKKGRQANAALQQARSTIAELLGARTEEIVFTAGGTESINLAIFGVARAVLTHPFFIKKGERGVLVKPHIITSTIEHHAVLKSFQALEQSGYATTYVGVDADGFLHMEELKNSITPETVLISIMYANNEIGTIEPIAEIGKWLNQLNSERLKNKLPQIIFHTDACQAVGALDCNVQHLGVDLLSANGSKMYGPKQGGFLYIKNGVTLTPLIYGGGQEKSLRSGTENVTGAVGLAAAFTNAQKKSKQENQRLKTLRDYFIKQLIKKIPSIVVNGPWKDLKPQSLNTKYPKKENKELRLPNNVNVSIVGVEGEALLLYLDSYNISVSTGSACSSTSGDPSHVIRAIGRSIEDAESSIRFTLGQGTTKKDLDYVLQVLPPLITELRKVNKIK